MISHKELEEALQYLKENPDKIPLARVCQFVQIVEELLNIPIQLVAIVDPCCPGDGDYPEELEVVLTAVGP